MRTSDDTAQDVLPCMSLRTQRRGSLHKPSGYGNDETCRGTGVANVCLNDSYNSYTLVANSQKDPVLIVMKWPTRNISHMEENHEDCNHL